MALSKRRLSATSCNTPLVKGKTDQLPFEIIKVIPFGITHAPQSGKFASIIFENKAQGTIIIERKVISNDIKLIAQADTEPSIRYFATDDANLIKMAEILHSHNALNFEFINLRIPFNEYFGELPI
jgi:hypothetical protein